MITQYHQSDVAIIHLVFLQHHDWLLSRKFDLTFQIFFETKPYYANRISLLE